MNRIYKPLIIKIVTLIFTIVFVVSCSPVRTKPKIYNPKEYNSSQSIEKSNTNENESVHNSIPKLEKDKNNDENISNQKNDLNNNDQKIIDISSKNIIKNEIDTTIISLEIEPISNSDFSKFFYDNVMLFDKKQYKESCLKFEEFANSLPENDSLFYESLFFVAECRIAEELYLSAEKTLLKILNGIKLPKDIKQRTYLRIGQVYCTLNRKNDSDLYFSKLKSEFPKSIYIQLANCNF